MDDNSAVANAMIPLEMRNLGFKIFFESGFWEGIHCLK